MRVNSAMLVVAVAAVAALLFAGCAGKTGNDAFVLPEKAASSNEMPPALPSESGAADQSLPPSPPSAASSGESSKSTLFK